MFNVEEKSYSIYARVLDKDDLLRFGADRTQQLYTLANIERQFTHQLRYTGRVRLYEVYNHLGIPVPNESPLILAGWSIDLFPLCGDDFVDFGLFDPRNRDFIVGLEDALVLDFNVLDCIH